MKKSCLTVPDPGKDPGMGRVAKYIPRRHLTSVGRQIDVRLRRHNDVGFRLILKVYLTSKTDVILTSKTDVILTSEKQRWFDVSNVTS